MIDMGRHALVEIRWSERKNNRAHAIEIIDSKRTCTTERTRRGSDFSVINQGFDDGEFAGSVLFSIDFSVNRLG